MAEYRTVTVVATVSNNVFNADGTVTTNSFDVTADGQQVVIVDPYISIEQTDEGAVVTVTDTRGSTQATIYNGQDGADGVSPGVSVSSVTGGHAVTIADAEHPTGQTFNVMDGQDGSDGQDGQDGVSPGVTITDFTGGHTVTITDADHPGGQSFNVFNGQNGIDGQDGAPGRDGSDGSDGVSPAVSVTSITGGHTVTITDADHPTGQAFNVMDGQNGSDGQDGQDGSDGVSPAVTISSITGGHRVNITDADHPAGQNFDVMDGEDGDTGPVGPGVPASGVAGQILGKASATDYATAWTSHKIPLAVVDNTSTSTAFTATVPGITALEDGVSVLLKNGIVTSASGFTINVNNLGAKPVYNSMATGNDVDPKNPTRETTIFNINYTLLLVYSSDLVDGGAWINYRGYNSDNNTIGYQLRTNSSTMPMDSVTYRYRLLFTKADGTKWVPANNSTSTNATASRTTIQTPIDPFGEIVYYGTTTSVAANSNPGAAYLWQQYTLSLGYSFNRTGAALVLQYPKPVYLKCAPQTNGSAIIDADTPYVQALPSAADGKIYIYLGRAYSATNIELTMKHPVYWHDGTGIKLWAGADPAGLNITGASADDLIKVTSVDTNGTPTAWEPAVVGTDYPDPAKYTDLGVVISQPNVTARQGSIIMTTDDWDEFSTDIDSTVVSSIILGGAPYVGAGGSKILVGGVGGYSSYYDLLPNMQPIIDPTTKRARSRISGVGSIGVGVAVCPEANGAAAFGALQRVTGTYGFAAGGYNYVSANYSCAIGRYLEAKSQRQAVFGIANDNKSEDYFEVGNGSAAATGITRSNAFRVTSTGSAIAQTALGIEDGQGGVVSVTASELSGIKSNTLTSASIDATGLISFKNGNTTVFTLQLPIYNGGVSNGT